MVLDTLEEGLRSKKRKRSSGGGNLSAASLAAHLNTKFGDDSAKTLDEDILSAPKTYISSQHPLIDMAIGHPGFPAGRISSIFGESSTGKTHILYHTLAETQRRGGIAMLIDAEYALDPDRASLIGIDCSKLVVTQPETLEEGFEHVREAAQLIRTEHPDKLVCIGFDSVAGIGTKAEMEDKNTQGGHARAMSKILRRITKEIADYQIALIIINQYREKIDGFGYGPKKTMLAENPIRFASSVAFEIARTSLDQKDKNDPTGIFSEARNKKNKISAPFRRAQFRIGFDCGIDILDGLLELGMQSGMIKKAGAYLQYGDKSFYRKDWASVLRENYDIVPELLAVTGFEYPSGSRLLDPLGLYDEEETLEAA